MNNTRWHTSIFAAVCLLLSGCFGLFDNGTDHIVDNYDVTWIDLHIRRALYNTEEIVPAYVAAVGYNSEYLFVKQHPLAGEFDSEVLESVTHYYLIKRTKSDSQDQPVYGPLTEEVFNQLCNKLGVKEVTFSTRYPENI
ncbi:DUF3997 domain-containing protein [Hymenobacter metallilatus]|uniref:DUF3997 domain-containing protein n=1 Tax=Hymenobacter metallilatus TaxID=2493666 RepID=A0A3R9M9M9_9BACT|nr:DUF3997 domain-containing protein [Hymenobacter metallilatus]RSK36282.1 DUF3997 domain-containing protein [Hymenobacter metallilatus]